MKQILYLMVLLFLVSCKSKETIIEVPKIKTEIQYRDRIVCDSVYIKDSVLIYTKGDTVYNTIYNKLYKYKIIKDTINIYKVDTISIPQKVVVTKTVTKQNIVQRILMYIGIVSLSLIILIIYIKIKKC